MGQAGLDPGCRGGAVMQWGSVAEFFAMGGYGLYVWPSFGVAALCMGGEILAVWRRHAAALESHDES